MEFLYFLSGYRTPALDLFFQAVTYMAQELFTVAVICWFYWCSDKKQAYSLGFTYFSSGLLVQGLKITFRIPRPWILDPNFQPVASALPGATGYSFPSGHTQSITALFGTLFLRFKETWKKLLCAAVILLVMFSRMYLGCHTPKDVLVSFTITILCVFLANYFLYKRDFAAGHQGVLSLIMAGICILLCLYSILLNRNGIISTDYTADCLKASGAGLAFSAGFYIEKRYIRFSPPEKFRAKLIRITAGLAVAAVLLEGSKAVIGTSLAASFIRYFVTVAWIIVIYPCIFTNLHTSISHIK